LALFIDRQHQGLVGRIEVEADDILDLGDEVRIAALRAILFGCISVRYVGARDRGVRSSGSQYRGT
jgi:hypothetical protein